MSYDVWLEVNAGAGPVKLDLLDANYTYNCGRMLYEAVGMSFLTDLAGESAGKVASILDLAIAAMTFDPARFEAMNPENSLWGDAKGWLAFLTTIRDACLLAPDATLVVS